MMLWSTLNFATCINRRSMKNVLPLTPYPFPDRKNGNSNENVASSRRSVGLYPTCC
jgi:hypothetical protein